MKYKNLVFVTVICFLSAISAIIGGMLSRQIFDTNVFAKSEKEIIPKINSKKKGEKAFAGPTTDYIDGVRVVAGSPSDGQVLKYDGVTDSRWELGTVVGSGTDSVGLLSSACIESGEQFGFTGGTAVFTTLFTIEIYILPGGVTTLRGKMFFDHEGHASAVYTRFKIGATVSTEATHSVKTNSVWSDEMTMSFSSTGWQTLELQGKPTISCTPDSEVELRGWVIYGE